MTAVSALRARPALSIAVLAVVVTGVTAGVVRGLTGRRVDAAQGERVLLADVANETGDTLFDRSLAAAATVALQQSSRLTVYPRAQVPAIYRMMEIANPSTPLSLDLAQEVAQRGHVRFVVALRVARRGTGYLLNARLVDGLAHRTVTDFSRQSRTQNDVLYALDGLMVSVRRTLGESGHQTWDHRAPLPVVTTSSLAALKSYADGGAAWQRGDYRVAVEYWQRAVDLDTGFAMAYGALGGASYFMHDRYDGERYYESAFRRTERLTDWEQLALRARRAGDRQSTDSALLLARLRVERYPNAYTYMDLGGLLMRARHDADALAALRQVLGMDSRSVEAWIDIATVHARAGRPDSAIAAYQRAAAIDSTILYRDNINNEYGGALVEAARFAQADSVFRRMTTVSGLYNQSLGFRSLGFLALWRGQLDEATTNFRRAAELMRQQPSALSEGRNRLLIASVARAAGHIGAANVELDRVMQLIGANGFEPAMLGIVAYQNALLGRTRDVDATARLARARARADNAIDQGSIAFIDAVAGLVHNHPDSAVANVGRAASFPWPQPRIMVRAEAFAALGQRDSARAALRELNGQRAFGSEGEDDWLRSPLLLGDALLAAHDTAGATQAYQRLLDQWRDASPATPDLASARRRLASIAAAHPRH